MTTRIPTGRLAPAYARRMQVRWAVAFAVLFLAGWAVDIVFGFRGRLFVYAPAIFALLRTYVWSGWREGYWHALSTEPPTGHS